MPKDDNHRKFLGQDGEGYCDECRFWTRKKSGLPWGDCFKLADPKCQWVSIEVEIIGRQPGCKSITVTVETEADFGCNLWEKN